MNPGHDNGAYLWELTLDEMQNVFVDPATDIELHCLVKYQGGKIFGKL